MTLDELLGVGVVTDLGTETFDADSIKAFARKFDPQPFHVDEEAARSSVFGGLCASGWHTAASWMKRNLATRPSAPRTTSERTGPKPKFGPSPGISKLKWLKPVYAGETVRYTRCVTAYREIASRPGWLMLTVMAEGFDTTGDKVIEFESAVMLQVA